MRQGTCEVEAAAATKKRDGCSRKNTQIEGNDKVDWTVTGAAEIFD